MAEPFTDEHDQLREVVRSFVTKEVNPHVPGWEREGMMPLLDLFARMAELASSASNTTPSTAGRGRGHPPPGHHRQVQSRPAGP